VPVSREDLPFLLLAASNTIVDGIQAGMARRGYGELRPVHGYVFIRLSAAPCTIVELAAYLDVTKQSAGQLADELTRLGYVDRTPHPTDRRAQLLTLSRRGRAATRAATAAAAGVIAGWEAHVPARRLDRMAVDLAQVADPARIRPTW
jgi:DNA-binding MarR family transcriptional regulator